MGVVLQRIDAARPAACSTSAAGRASTRCALAEALPQATVTGVDLSASSVAQAEAGPPRTSRRRPPQLRRRPTTSTFAGGPFDVIVSETVLHTIPVPTDTLFDKIARDLTPAGLLVYTMPTASATNTALTLLRRALRRLRGRTTDRVLLRLARALHGRAYDDTLLRERIPYMYLVPSRHDSRRPPHPSRERAGASKILATEPVARASLAQLTHRLVVARRG